ncbi:YdcF family protein [Bifidobacterium moukalabense]|nr:YdcF family protein [Bifidobacterium moukalabense]
MTMLGLVYCILGVMLCIATFFLARRHPNHISNGFVLELSVIFLLSGVLCLAMTHMGTFPWLKGVFYVLVFIRPVLFAILGFALLANGVIGVRREGLSLTNALPFAWGIMLLFSDYWFLWGPGWGMSGSELYVRIMTFVSMMVSYVPIAVLGVWFSNDICYKSAKAPETEYIIVLGCSILDDGTVTPLLRGRLDAAIAAWERGGRRATIITSGGQGHDEVISESRAMAHYLLLRGVPESSILLEDKSSTTEENLAFSRAIMDARGGAAHCTIATSSYHCLRAAMFARRLGINANCVGGHTAAFFYPAAFFREYIALIMRNRPAVAVFFGLVVVRFVLILMNILPESIFL